MLTPTQGPYRIASYGEEDGKSIIMRENDGSLILLNGSAGSDDPIPVRVCIVPPQVRPKRGEGFRLAVEDDPEGYANALLFSLAWDTFQRLKALIASLDDLASTPTMLDPTALIEARDVVARIEGAS